MYGEDYERHWNYADFKDKVVLDLGADLGSTACWFFNKRAKKIVAVEADDRLYSQLQENYGLDPDVVTIHLCIDSPEQITQLITQYRPDIVKVDIEGAESNLSGIPSQVLKLVPTYLVETHAPDLEQSVNETFRRLGYIVEKCVELTPSVKVFRFESPQRPKPCGSLAPQPHTTTRTAG